ncbi:MAG: hypothetical protein ACLTML_08880 [Blautia faecis]
MPAFQLLSGEETTAGTACIETFLAQHFIRNGYALSYWSSGNQAEVPFTVQKQSFYCHRLPHHPTSEMQEPYAAE